MNSIVNEPGRVGATAGSLPAGETAAARGSFRGEQVQHVRDPIAELQDAAEELTFGESERVEKKLSERKLRGARGECSAALEQAEKYLRDVPDLERNQKLADFAKGVLERGRPPNPDELRQSAREFSDDATHQFLALSFSRERAGEENADPALVAALDEAITALQAESGPAIQAGLNVSAVARQHADGNVGDIQQLRDFYRDIVLDCETINDAYERVVADHPGESFEAAVRFMLKALSADLDAGTRSISRTRIKQVMDDMYQLKSLNSVHEQCEDLIGRVRKRFDANPGPTAARDLLSELLTAQNRAWQGADAFNGLPGKMGVQGDQSGIYFLQGVKELVRFVPLKAFGDDMTKRERIMISVQQALDSAIDAEEYDD
ncbi:MAG: type III secretion system gatekeeper subunit SctW [Gammaproteobacteria bacterium]|nr:type III secretion system gatekeeper subunit SctW [Gammaproteobacteria bacterium]